MLIFHEERTQVARQVLTQRAAEHMDYKSGKLNTDFWMFNFCHHVEKADFLELGPHFSQLFDPGGKINLLPPWVPRSWHALWNWGSCSQCSCCSPPFPLLSLTGVVVSKNSLGAHCRVKACGRKQQYLSQWTLSFCQTQVSCVKPKPSVEEASLLLRLLPGISKIPSKEDCV